MVKQIKKINRNHRETVTLSLFAIAWPIFIESALQTLMRTSDTFMLSRLSDSAVAAVGVANQIIMFTMLLFNFISIGSAVVVAQYLGARQQQDIGKLVSTVLAVNFLFGLLVSLCIFVSNGAFLHLFQLNPILFHLAQRYLFVAGGMLFIQAVLSALIAVIQAHGYTRYTMMVTISMNLLNITGNLFVIYGLFGFPRLGVAGIAMSTVFSQCVGLLLNGFLLTKRIQVRLHWQSFLRWNKAHVLQVLRIGIPSSAVTISYSVNQFVMTAFISTLGANMLTARIYTQNISFIITVLAISLGRAMQIIVGHLVGAGQKEAAYSQVLRNLFRCLMITMSALCILAVFRVPLLRLFTHNPQIISLGAMLILLGFLLEPGRDFNIIIEKSLQAAGDARYAMLAAIVTTWTISVPLAYLLGIHWGFGLIGIWIAFIVDEWIRGLILLRRWRSKRWQGKAIVQNREEVML